MTTHPDRPHRRVRLPRKALAATALLLGAQVLAGCVEISGDLTVHDDATTSGTLTVTATDGATLGTDPDQVLPPGITMEDQVDGDRESSTITLDRAVLDGSNPEVPLVVTREGDTVTFALHFDPDAADPAADPATDPAADPDAAAEPGLDSEIFVGMLMEAIGEDFDISVSFPGQVTESNGVVDGQTVRWDGEALRAIVANRDPAVGFAFPTLQATASLAPAAGSPDGAGSADDTAVDEIADRGGVLGSVTGIFSPLVLAAILAAAALGLLVLRRRRKAAPNDSDDEWGAAGFEPTPLVVDDTDTGRDEEEARAAAREFPSTFAVPTAAPFRDTSTSHDTPLAQPLHHQPSPTTDPDVKPVADPTPVVAPPVATASGTAPGWYQTTDGKHLRWHDGTAWTDYTQPVPTDPPAEWLQSRGGATSPAGGWAP